MVPGFKTGPRNWDVGREIVEKHGARMGEVWFNADDFSVYEETLPWFAERKVSLGLHYWGSIPYTSVTGKEYMIKPNLATTCDEVRLGTVKQIRETIDYATTLPTAYVNVHPGAAYLEFIDLQTGLQGLVPDEEPAELDESARLFLESAHELKQYAVERDVLLTFETIPAREYQNDDRADTYDSQNIALDTLAQLGDEGLWLANDISHTVSFLSLGGESRDIMWDSLYGWSEKTAPFTRLLHLNTLEEPFNGTDSHNGITTADFADDVFPTRDQVLEWLRLYSGRDDVFVVLEPRDAMLENYVALVEMLAEVE